MEVEKALTFLNSSFLSPLLDKDDITDISYNGSDIYYVSNIYGRQRSDIKVEYSKVKDFIRQLANISEKQFSYLSPYLDVSIGRYRFNAVHQSVARRKNEETLNFAIRIAGEKERINDESGFVIKDLRILLEIFLEEKMSLVLGGVTGCGKTEFQKYLVKKMKPNTRIIVIDNILELSNISGTDLLDLNVWQSDEKNKESSMQNLVRNALRCNPDWLIVAESLGAEMIDVLNSAMTGHPIITTLHAFDVDSMPSRMGRMVMMNDKKMDFESVMVDIYYHFRIFIYLRKEVKKDGSIYRYISDVAYFDQKGNKHNIYTQHYGIIGITPLTKEFLRNFKKESLERIPKVFMGQ